MKTCVEDCTQSCHHIRESSDCKRNKMCKSGCGCPSGLLDNGDKCVPESACECLDTPTKKLYKAGESWKRGCNTCTCFNNKVTCTKTPCVKTNCPAPQHQWVKKEGSCCPVCEKVVKECRKDQFDCMDGNCISKEWLCDRENDCTSGADEKNCTEVQRPCYDNLGKYHICIY